MDGILHARAFPLWEADAHHSMVMVLALPCLGNGSGSIRCREEVEGGLDWHDLLEVGFGAPCGAVVEFLACLAG